MAQPPSPPSPLAPFADVPPSHPHAKAITYMQVQGNVTGYPGGTYHPDQLVNRAEFTKLLMAATDRSGTGSHCFRDVADEWFAPPICRAKREGVIGGYVDGTFRPNAPIVFSEAAKIVSKLFAPPPAIPKAPWYAPSVVALNLRGAIPDDLTALDQPLTRGQVSEMIFRLRSLESWPARDLSAFGLKVTPPRESHSPDTTEAKVAFPYSLRLGDDWRKILTKYPAEHTLESLSNAELLTESGLHSRVLRVHFPRGSDSQFWPGPSPASVGGFDAFVWPDFPPQSSLYLQYYVRWPKAFDFSIPGSLPGIGANFGGPTANERQQWFGTGIGWSGSGTLRIDTTGMDTTTGEFASADTNIPVPRDGQWHRVDLHVSLDPSMTLGNGTLEAWFDGGKVISNSHIDYPQFAKRYAGRVDRWDSLYLIVSLHTESSPTDTFIDLADIAFSDKPIQ